VRHALRVRPLGRPEPTLSSSRDPVCVACSGLICWRLLLDFRPAGRILRRRGHARIGFLGCIPRVFPSSAGRSRYFLDVCTCAGTRVLAAFLSFVMVLTSPLISFQGRSLRCAQFAEVAFRRLPPATRSVVRIRRGASRHMPVQSPCQRNCYAQIWRPATGLLQSHCDALRRCSTGATRA
jgi:hypothetical protein